MVEKSHERMAGGFSGVASFIGGVIFVQTCLTILFKKVETVLLREGEFTDIRFPVWREFL